MVPGEILTKDEDILLNAGDYDSYPVCANT